MGETFELGSERKLRVLVFTTVFPSRAAPLHGLFVYERNRHLAKYATLCTVAPVPWFRRLRSSNPGHEQRGGLRVAHPTFFYLPRFMKPLDGFFLFISTLATVWRLHREFKFDLIDAHFAYPDGCAAVLLGMWFRIPVLITLHGTEIQLLRFRMRSAIVDWSIRRATHVIAVAENLAARALKARMAPDRVTVIPSGVDLHRFSPIDRATARQRLGIPVDGKLIVSVGHVSRRKGFQRVIRVLPGIARKFPDVTFAIVGGQGAEGDIRPELKCLAQKLDIVTRVRFVGACSPDQVATWLNAADLFVLASDFEGSPNVVREAMACGCPVVTSCVGDARRMVASDVGVIVDDPDDSEELSEAIWRSIARPWDAKRIRAHTIPHAWDKKAEQIFGIWNCVVDQYRYQTVRAPTRLAPVKALALNSGSD